MFMKYLNKAGKYISNHRLLFIICVVAAFIIIANVVTYLTPYEHYGNCTSKKETFTNENEKKESFTNTANNGMSTFMQEQLKNANM